MPRRMREHPTGRDTTYCGYEVGGYYTISSYLWQGMEDIL